FSGLRRLPEREVDRAPFLLVDFDARAGALEQVADCAVRQLAIAREGVDLEVDALTLDHVRATALYELGDQRLHLADEVRRMRHVVGTTDVETIERAQVLFLEPAREGQLGRSDLCRPLDDPILDVGDVAHERHAVPAPFEIAPDRVEHHRIAAVAEVRKVVRGRPAHVYRHGSLATGNELDLVPSSSVVDAKHELRLASSGRRVGRVSMRAISLDHPRVNSATAQTAIPSERP